MNDHSPHFNNVLTKRPFSANIVKNLLFFAWKEKISKTQQPSCLLFFIVIQSKPTEFLFSQIILKDTHQVCRDFQVQVEKSTLLHDKPDHLLLLASKRGFRKPRWAKKKTKPKKPNIQSWILFMSVNCGESCVQMCNIGMWCVAALRAKSAPHRQSKPATP